MHRYIPLPTILAVLLLAATTAAAQTREAGRTSPLTVDQIMQDPATWVGDWPEDVRWGERGEYLYFSWNPRGRFASDSLYRVPRDGGEPEQVSPEERRATRTFFDGWHHGQHVYDADFRHKVFASGGDLFVVDRRTGRQTRLTRTQAREDAPRFTPDGESLVFTRDDNLFRLDLSTGAVVQLTDLRRGRERPEDEPDDRERFLEEQQQALFEVLRKETEEREQREAAQEREVRAEDEPPTYYYGDDRLSQLRLSPDGRFVTFTRSSRSEPSRTQVLDYVTESGYAEVESARAKVGDVGTPNALYVQDLERDTTYQVDLLQLPGAYDVPAYRRAAADTSAADTSAADSSEVQRALYVFGPLWSGDGRYAVIEVRAQDNKDRWIARLDAATGNLTVLDRQQDEAWIAGPGISWWGGASTMGWMPDAEHVYFQSERSGFSHLYTVHVATGAVRALTSGDFEVFEPVLARDGEAFYVLSSEGSPFERHVWRVPVHGGERTRLTQLEGGLEFALSPDAEQLGLLHSTSTQPPEVYLQRARRGAEAERLTASPTEQWRAYDWRPGEIVRFEASDGASVPAQVFTPDDPNGAAVLFVHGAGYLQNVHRGWSSYFREYMFHNLLTDLGYTVMNVDYRASSGYGRDWRTAIYRHMGGRDLQDYVDAQQYLEATYDVPAERTFIYGGSYGGFITLMALFTEPEHFGGGAALRSVTDWAHYNHPYTANILNTPQTDSLAYARSSPIYFAEGLEDPLLIAHGVMDTNVQFQDVVRLAQRLIELGKEDWEMALYPVEGHGFTEPSSWADEYRRILELVEVTVGPDEALEVEPVLEAESDD